MVKISDNLTDALGNPWEQHAQEYYRIPPDGNGNVLKKVYEDGQLVGSERVQAPDFMQWKNGTGPAQVVGKNLRDFLQSAMAWGVPRGELEYIAELMGHLGMYAIAKTGGGAMKQVADKNLEYGWENLRVFAALTADTPGEALGREDCLVSYDKCPRDLATLYYDLMAPRVDTNRAFTGSNNHQDDVNAYAATLQAGMKVQGEITYPVRKMPTEWYVEQALRKVDMGATTIGIKDGTGRLTPDEATEIVSALREALPANIRINMHCQETLRIAKPTYKAGLEAGADSIHVVVGGPAELMGTFPSVVTMMDVLSGTDRWGEYEEVMANVRGKTVNVTEEASREMQRIIDKFPYLKTANQGVDERARQNGAPGGGQGAYEVWLKENGWAGAVDANLDKQREVLSVMGEPASITPYYKMACDQAALQIAQHPRSSEIMSGKLDWNGLSDQEKQQGNWKVVPVGTEENIDTVLTPAMQKLFRGGFDRMPADEDPSILTPEVRELRENLRQRVLHSDLKKAIEAAEEAKDITSEQAAALKENAITLLQIGEKINDLYEPTRQLRAAQNWVNDCHKCLTKLRGEEHEEHFTKRLEIAQANLKQVWERTPDTAISHEEYVEFTRNGTLSEKILAAVKEIGENKLEIEIADKPLGKIINASSYAACPPADVLKPRLREYVGKVKDLLRERVTLGDVTLMREVDFDKVDAYVDWTESDDFVKWVESRGLEGKKPDPFDDKTAQFMEAVAYAAMYNKKSPKTGIEEGITLLRAFDIKARLIAKRNLPGELADAALKMDLVKDGDDIHSVLAKYDKLKRGQALQMPVVTLEQAKLQAEARMSEINLVETKATKTSTPEEIEKQKEGVVKAEEDLKARTNKLIRTVHTREVQEAKIKTGLSEDEIAETIRPMAEKYGQKRFEMHSLEDQRRLATANGGKGKDDIESQIEQLRKDQGDIADKTRRVLREERGFSQMQLEATVRVFNRVALETTRNLWEIDVTHKIGSQIGKMASAGLNMKKAEAQLIDILDRAGQGELAKEIKDAKHSVARRPIIQEKRAEITAVPGTGPVLETIEKLQVRKGEVAEEARKELRDKHGYAGDRITKTERVFNRVVKGIVRNTLTEQEQAASRA